LTRVTKIHRKKKYTVFYRIYRRIRYLNFVRKKRKRTLRELKAAKKTEIRQARNKSREQLKKDLLEDKRRRLLEKERTAREAEEEKARLARVEHEYRPIAEAERAKLKKEEKLNARFNRRRKRRLARTLFRSSVRRFKQGLLSLNVRNLKRWIRDFKSRKESRRNLLSIAVNSSSLFILSYLFVYIFALLITSLTGTLFEYSSTIYYYDIYFTIRGDQWYHDAVKVIYSSAPFACLFIGTLLLIIFSYIREDKGIYKMFFFWGFLHSYTMFFGGVLVGTIFGTGLGHAINWSYILDTGKMVYSIISIAVFILIGVLSSKSFLISANTYYNNLTMGAIRGRFVWAQMVLPFLAGNIMMFVFRMPRLKMYYIFVAVTMILVIIPAWVSTRFYPNMYFHEDPVKIRVRWKLAALALGVYAILRILLGIGIPVDFT
jgi:hypothetical protein